MRPRRRRLARNRRKARARARVLADLLVRLQAARRVLVDGIKLCPPDMLPCPECDTPAIPASGTEGGLATWAEDDEGTCPGCGARLVVRVDDGIAEAQRAVDGGTDGEA